jgi:hypothetical protein
MFWRKRFIFYGIFFFLLFILNFVARKKMSYSYADLPGYDQLYLVKEQLRISQVTEHKDHSVTIAFTGKGVKKENVFKVYQGDKLLATASGPTLTFNPLPGPNSYCIRLNDIPNNISIDLNYAPDSVYKSIGNRFSGGSELTNTSIPVQQEALYSITDWAWNNTRFENDEREAAIYLKDSMKVLPTDPATVRVLKIAQFILERTKGMDGIPTDSMIPLSPINQLKCAQAGKSKLWCGLYADMFAWFANRAGVPARYIECSNSRLKISCGVHVFNEVYIDEYGQWVYLDLLAKTIFVKKGEKYLNVVDVHRLLKYSINDSDLVADYFNGDSIVQTPFNRVASTARYYFHQNNTFTFYFGDYLNIQPTKGLFGRAKKALSAKPYYALYGDSIGFGNWQLIFRIATTYALFLFPVFCLFVEYIHRKKKRIKALT